MKKLLANRLKEKREKQYRFAERIVDSKVILIAERERWLTVRWKS